MNPDGASEVSPNTPIQRYKYFEAVVRNAADMKDAVNTHHTRLFRALTSGSDLTAAIQAILDENSLERLKLHEDIVDFFSEATLLAGSEQLDVSQCFLLQYSPSEAGEQSLGSFTSQVYQPQPLSADVGEQCGTGELKCTECIGRLSLNQSTDGSSELALNARSGFLPNQTCAHGSVGSASGGDVVHEGVGINRAEDINQKSMAGVLCQCTADGIDKEKGQSVLSDTSVSPQSLSELELGSLSLGSMSESEALVAGLHSDPPLERFDSTNSIGPFERRNYVLLLPAEVPPLYVTDIYLHSLGAFLCADSLGLWFSSEKTSEPLKVSERKCYSLCASYAGEEAYSVGAWGGGGWVRKYDLRTGLPVETEGDGFFQVNGGECLTGISLSPQGLLAISDVRSKRVTIHKQTGMKLYELRELFDRGRPYHVCWLSEHRLTVQISGGGGWDSWWISCIKVPGGDLMWKSLNIPGAMRISCLRNRVYVAMEKSASFKTLDALNGQELEEDLPCGKDYAIRVFDVDGCLTTVSFNWSKMK